MSRPDEGLIHAWLDGELEADEAARVARLVETDAEWSAAAAEARGLIAASSRILGALDVVAGDVIPGGGSAAPVESSVVTSIGVRRRVVPTWMKVAAGLVLVAGVSYLGRGRGAMERADEVAATFESVPQAAPAAPPAVASVPDAAAGAAAGAAAPANEVPAPMAAKARVAASDAAAPAQVAEAPAAAPAPAPLRAAPSREALMDVVVTSAPSEVVRAVDTTDAARRAERESRAAMAKASADASREAMALRARAAAPIATVTGGVASRVSSGVAGGVAAQSLAAAPPATIAGCWRVLLPARDAAARVDAVQVQPRIVRVVGDSTEVLLTPSGALAWVVRDSADVLRGRVRDAAGVPAAFRAVREACAP